MLLFTFSRKYCKMSPEKATFKPNHSNVLNAPSNRNRCSPPKSRTPVVKCAVYGLAQPPRYRVVRVSRGSVREHMTHVRRRNAGCRIRSATLPRVILAAVSILRNCTSERSVTAIIESIIPKQC